MAILGFLEPKDQVAPARTNQLWSEIALDLIWKDLDSIIPLLTVLGPLSETKTRDGKQVYVSSAWQ